ncbi:MAG: ATPase [Parcubacteria group bacterium Gr01-1014_29]|nr:MAG: ATPase [Parcubacteria group bacterium Gr01-1014_29]
MAENQQTPVHLRTASPLIFRAVRFEALLPRLLRRNVLAASFFLFILIGAIYLVLAVAAYTSFESGVIQGFRNIIGGIALVLAGPLWFLIVAEFYFLTTSRSEPLWDASLADGEKTFYCNYGAARRLWRLDAFRKDEVDVAVLYQTFLEDTFTKQLFLRLGVPWSDVGEFLGAKEKRLPISRDLLFQTLVYEAHEARSEVVTAREFALLLFDLDKDFESFLFQYEIRKDTLLGAADWVSTLIQLEQSRLRWWERALLGRMPTFGASLLFGYTYTLDKFAHDVRAGGQGAIIPKGAVHVAELSEIAEILARSAQANVLLVGEPGSGKMAILEQLTRLILEGAAPAPLWQKRLVTMDTMALTATTKQKGDLEALVIKVMNEASIAGNIVLILERFPEFIESAAYLGVNAVTLLEPYLEGTQLQVVALSDKEQFHRTLETNPTITKLFEKVEVKEPEGASTVFILEESAYDLEKRYPVVVSYQALLASTDLADRYITDGAMPEKAIDLLERAITQAVAAGERVVEKRHVERAVEERTHIPVQKASGKEVEQLLKMEGTLHQRIIGQHVAITAIANALRRARSGLHAGKRPIGSFLFLGPTGVGKTETAKALAQIYFGSEDLMVRFDMSEFQGPEGVNKLIGSFDTGEPGALANALRAHPFSLLLFDEFEKSSREVVNLFLQILEEGFFTDARGKRVSARDTIIITTSNAGSNLIWDMVRQGKDPALLQKEVVDAIRQEGIFAPEVLNRFDAVVVYEPLDKEKLQHVARLLLAELAAHLKKQDIELVITDDLIAKVVEIGFDPVMGARPMRRAITDRVEQIIARKLLDGSLQRGQTFQFTPEEVSKL